MDDDRMSVVVAEDGSETPLSADEGDDLHESLHSLGRLAMRRLGLEEVLTSVATYAVRAIPGADGAGLTLLERDRPDTVVSTADFVTQVDDVQYGLGQGPCISAAADGVTVVSGSLGGDPRWKQFGSRVARLGVHSVISLPLVTHDGVLGAMNVYAHDKEAFDERAVAAGELFAVSAAIAVQNAQALAEAHRLVQKLQDAVTSRASVDHAVGILLARGVGTRQEALDRLRRRSMDERRPLVDVARDLVDETVRRQAARRS